MSITFISFLVGLVMITPAIGFAAPSDEQALQAQIQALRQQISDLLQSRQSTIGELSMPQSPFSPSNDQPGDEPPPTAVITFDRDLYYGLRNDSDVSNLQEFLIDQGFLKGVQTGNYFLLTQKAVQQFQSAHSLRPTGYFGPLTRAVANKILARGVSGGGGGVFPIRSQPFYSVEPAGPFLRGQKYDFNAKISNGKPNAQVLLFLERPDGSMKYDGIACLGSVTGKCALYTDASGSLLTASYELITDEGQNGTWISWVTVGGIASNKLHHMVIPSGHTGYLSIDPAYAELKIGGTQRIQAIFIPSRPACFPACEIAEQAPYEVRASISSSHPSIAE
ncbi:MAG: peptidoglycan-binding domain-containing protein, partial [Patescibacteria group bacterium]